jgi:hypothetical protein
MDGCALLYSSFNGILSNKNSSSKQSPFFLNFSPLGPRKQEKISLK